MRRLFPTQKQGSDSADLSQYVRDAFSWARDYKEPTQRNLLLTDQYFQSKAEVPELVVDLCEGGDCPNKKAVISLDAIGQKVDAFVAVATDAVVQVDKPWEINPTPNPDVPEDYKQEVTDQLIQIIGQNAAAMSQGDEVAYYQMLMNVLEDKEGAYDEMRAIRDEMLALVKQKVDETARETANTFDSLVSDDMVESNWDEQSDNFIHSFAKYDFGVMKTPDWVIDYKEEVRGRSVREIKTTRLKHENIHPKNYYCSEDSTWDDCGTFEMDVSTLSMNDLLSAKGFDGFMDKEIDSVCEFFGKSGRNWLDHDYDCTVDVDKWRNYEHIPVLKYSGRVDCCEIEDFISKKDKDKLKRTFKNKSSYECTIWVIHDFVVYFDIPLSNITRRPYKVATYSKKGEHKYEGRGIFSLCIEFQAIIDKFATMVIENANLAAGGIIGYNAKKIDTKDFHPSSIRGGARIPVKSSIADGGNDRPIFEIRFDSHVSEFFGIISQMEQKMDERSQIPSFSVGFGNKISSVRSTGIASLNQANVNKAVLRKMYVFEKHVVTPTVKQLVSYHLWTTKDPRILDGAVDVKVRGYSEIIRKQDRQQNLDLVMQNAIGLQNAINQMQTQGQDVTGLVDLFKRYMEMSGIDSDKFFDQGQADISSGLVAQVGGDNVAVDGRSIPSTQPNASGVIQ